ncbi:MAG: TolC family protein [Desulfovibrionaceae bacterium]|nr:TolC family protein [Desulfovibrionaceae bacterium]MBF0515145.1 TolC family protein [Desulfovibrionaceae bacterium]
MPSTPRKRALAGQPAPVCQVRPVRSPHRNVPAWLLALVLLAALFPAPSQAQNTSPVDFAAQKYAAPGEASARAASPAPEPDAVVLDMQASVSRALQTNPQIESAKAQLRGAAAGEKSAAGALGPSGNVSASGQSQQIKTQFRYPLPPAGASILNVAPSSTANSGALDLNIHQNLFAGFKLLSNYQKAALAKESAEAGVSAAELKLVNFVQQTFLSLLKARADVKSAEDSVARLTDQLKVSQDFFDVGLKAQLDVLQNQTALASAEQTLLAAQNDVLTQTAQLNVSVGFPLQQDVGYAGELTQTPFAMDLARCLDLAYQNRPDLAVAVKSVEIAAKDARIAVSGLYPQAAADLDFISNANRSSINSDLGNYDGQLWQAKLSMQWTPWDNGATYFAYAQAVENVKKIYADMVKLRLDIGFQVKSSFLNIQSAAKRIGVAKTGLEAAKENYRLAVDRYQAQVGASLDVLNGQAQMTQAESDLSKALADYLTALSNLYAASGVKNPGLNPG